MFANPDQRKLAAALICLFLTVGAITAAFTFVDLLFLSTYPTDWLPYLFLGKTVTLLVFTLGARRLVVKGSAQVNGAILLVAAVSVLLARGLMELSLDGFPFALVLWLDAVAVVVGVVAFNAVYDTFDLRHMKRIGPRLNLAAGVGGLVFGLSLPWFIGVLGAEQVLFVVALPLAVAGLLVASLEPIAASERESRQPAQPLRYPLFVRASIAFVLLLVVDTLADYALKHEVALHYEGDAIGAFMGPFYGAVSAVTVMAQLGVVGTVLKRAGIRGLLSALPVFAILISIGLFLLPGLWLTAALRLGEIVLRRAFDDFGRALAVNPLPAHVKRSARLLWNGVAAPAGTCVGALVLLAVPTGQALQGVALTTLVCAVAWLLTVGLVLKSYQATLDEAVRVRRFGSAGQAPPEADPTVLEDIIRRCLAHEDSATVLFGYRLLMDADVSLPALVGRHLAALSPELRIAAIEAAAHGHEPALVDALFARIDDEIEPQVRWVLLHTLVGVDPQRALAQAGRLCGSPQPEDRAAALLMRLRAGDGAQVVGARAALLEMAGSPDAVLRCLAARVLGNVSVDVSREPLRALLDDDDEGVRTAALRAVATCEDGALAPEVARLLGRRARGGLTATTILVSCGEHSVPALGEVAVGTDELAARAAIRVLARIPGAATEQALAMLTGAGGVPRRTLLARETAAYARRHGASEVLRTTAREQVHAAAGQVQALRVVATGPTAPHYAAEVDVRRQLAERRLLGWFAVATDPARVLEAMPAVLSQQAGAGQDRAKALELLETLTGDPGLREALNALETTRPTRPGEVPDIDDAWLERMSAALPEDRGDRTMELSHRVVLLRQCPLFEHLEGEALLAIAGMGEVRELVAGEHLFRSGDSPDGLYVVISGLVNLMNEGELLAILKTADVIGEMELLDDSRRLADAVVRTDGSALFIDRETFESLSEDIPEVLRDLARRILQHLRASLTDDDPTRLATRLRGKPAASPAEKPSGKSPERQSERSSLESTRPGTADSPAPHGLRKLRTGDTVNLAAAPGEEVFITFANHRFGLRMNDQPVLVAPGGERTGLTRGENLLGRDERCDIVVDAKLVNISRQHAVLHWQHPGQLRVTCLSTHGTSVPEKNVV